MDELVWRERRREHEVKKRLLAPIAALALGAVAAAGAWMYTHRDTSKYGIRTVSQTPAELAPRPREAWVRNLPAVPLPVRPPEPVRRAPKPVAPAVAKPTPPPRSVKTETPVAKTAQPEAPPRQSFVVDVTPEPTDPTIYSLKDGDVQPPVSVSPKQLGRMPRGIRLEDIESIEVVVNRKGVVESVKAQRRPETLADAAVVTMSLSAAKSWHFQPARKDGVPVKYRQVIPVTVR